MLKIFNPIVGKAWAFVAKCNMVEDPHNLELLQHYYPSVSGTW